MLGGVLAGLGGAFLSMEQSASFQHGMTAGRGFIGLAAMIVGRWTPLGAFGAALLFASTLGISQSIKIAPPSGPARRHPDLASRPSSSTRCRTSSRSSSWPASSAGASRRPPTASRTSARPRPDARGARAAAAFLDLDEGRGPVPVLDDAGIERALRATRRIAVIGASSNAGRPSFGVFRYLVQQGFECVPVNPNEREVLGVPAVPDARRRGRRDRPVRHDRRLPALRAVRRARARSGRRRRALPVAPARRRELGGGADRARRRAGGRDGPLHRDRVAEDRRALRWRRGDAPVRPAGQRIRNPRKTSTTPAIAMAAADLGLAAEDRHRHRGPGRAVVADAAAPGPVAGRVGVLRLERLVARPRAPGASCSRWRSGRPRPATVRCSTAPPVQPSSCRSASSRSRTAAWTSAAFAWPRVAFMTCPTRKPTACALPAR